MQEFHSFSEELEEDLNLLTDSKSIESYLRHNGDESHEAEDFSGDFREPDIVDLAEELGNLETNYLNNILQLKASFLREEVDDDPWEGISETITDLVKRCDSKKLELLETLHAEKSLSNRISSLRSEISGLKRKKGRLSSEISSMETNLSNMNRDIDYCKEQYEVYMSLRTRSEDLREEIGKYAKVLGLELEIQDEKNFILKLFKLDPQDPEREFSAHLSLESPASIKEPTVVYSLHTLTPEINGIKELEDLLNQTQDLNGFLVTLRTMWKNKILKGNI